MANCCEILQMLSIGSAVYPRIYLAPSGNWRGRDLRIAQLVIIAQPEEPQYDSRFVDIGITSRAHRRHSSTWFGLRFGQRLELGTLIFVRKGVLNCMGRSDLDYYLS
jgi:hypothetical protein